MKIFIPNLSSATIGGGLTFIRNFKKGLEIFRDVKIAENAFEADIVFIAGISLIDPGAINILRGQGKKIIFRVDNVPRKSRNKRNTPHDRMRDVANISDLVVYQSEWAKWYCQPLCGDGMIIYNGVDKKIFYPAIPKPDKRRYLFAYYGKNELKNFWGAHFLYQKIHRDDPDAEFWFVNDFGREYMELADANFDFWNGEKFWHLPRIESPDAMANLMRKCTHLLYPAMCDAAPNVVLEARACGLEIINDLPGHYSGINELLNPSLDISLNRMAEEYYSAFKLVLGE